MYWRARVEFDAHKKARLEVRGFHLTSSGRQLIVSIGFGLPSIVLRLRIAFSDCGGGLKEVAKLLRRFNLFRES
jgi:hypothetical protein